MTNQGKGARGKRLWLGPVVYTGMACMLGSCSAMRVDLGTRVELDKVQVAKIEAKLMKGPGIAPGQRIPLVVTLTEPNGAVLQTEGKGGGKVMWKELQVVGTLVSVDEKGNVSLPEDARESDGKTGHVAVTVPSHSDLRAELDIQVRHDFDFVADLSGAPGANGLSGLDGANGTSGTNGSIDANNPSAGGNGASGTNGDDGHNGWPGGDAPMVEVLIGLRDLGRPMLQAKVKAAGTERFYLVDTQGGTLTVKADGGPGGSGGRGGQGGQGGTGGSGIPPGFSGTRGMDGSKGWDGPMGKGGLITVRYDPTVTPYLKLIHVSSRNGPAPLYHQESVAAVW